MEINHSHPVIYLRGIQYSEIESLLQFIYLGEAKFYEERMNEFLSVSKSLEILGQSRKRCTKPLKQRYLNNKTIANNSKQCIYERNMCPKHKNVNWMV